VIAKITSGSSFGGVLDYLMNPKKEKQERGQEREVSRAQERQQEERQLESGRTSPEEVKEGDETRPLDNKKEEALRGRKLQENQPQIEERDVHSEHTCDLADVYEAGQRHRVIGGNLSGQTPRQLAREFGLVRELRPDIEKPVHHVSISAGKNDRLSVEQWQEIADTYIEKMGFQNSLHIVIQHRDSKHDHIHLVASRVDEDGKVISEWQSKRRAEKVMREIEEKYDLERLPLSREVMRTAPSRGEKEVFERTGKLSAKMSIQGHIERALRGQPTATEFIENLQRVGIEVIPNLQDTGRVSGITFRQGKELMKGSDLGRGCSWGALQKRGLSYDPLRDRPTIEAAWQRAEMSRTRASSSTLLVSEKQHVTTLSATPAARSAGQYLLDSVKSIKQIEEDFSAVQHLGRLAIDGSKAVKDLMPNQDNVERLQQAVGLEPGNDNYDILKRLNIDTGVESPDPTKSPNHTPDHMLGAAPTLEPTINREAQEQIIER